jgi:hypothetical protein
MFLQSMHETEQQALLREHVVRGQIFQLFEYLHDVRGQVWVVCDGAYEGFSSFN